MKINDIITEGYDIFTTGNEDSPFARRMAGKNGPVVRMSVTQDEFEDIARQQANDEMGSYDLATAQSIIDGLEKNGYEIIWPDAHSLNKTARELEKLSNDPRYKGNSLGLGMSSEVGNLRSRAKKLARDSFKVVK